MLAHITDQMNGALSLGSWCHQWQSCLEAGEPTGGAATPLPIPRSLAETSLPGPETSFRETGSAQLGLPRENSPSPGQSVFPTSTQRTYSWKEPWQETRSFLSLNEGQQPESNWDKLAHFGKIITYWVKVLVFSNPSFIAHSFHNFTEQLFFF